MRTIAIGDIHGCLDKLRDLIHHRIKPTSKDKLIFLGDYIDRGSDSAGVVEFLIDLKSEFPKTILLKGNHEVLMINANSDYEDQAGYSNIWMLNGGRATINSYWKIFNSYNDKMKLLIAKHFELFNSLPLFYETDTHYFCHAGIFPGTSLSEQVEEDLLWIRDMFLASKDDHGKIIVHGHTITDSVQIKSNRIGLDTGAFTGQPLSAIDVDSLEIFQSYC